MINIYIRRWAIYIWLIYVCANLDYEIYVQSDRLAAAFKNLGLKKNDHIAIWAFNSVEWYLSYLAAFRGGFVVVRKGGILSAVTELIA